MFCLGSKDGCSFCTYSLHILDEVVKLKENWELVQDQALNQDKYEVKTTMSTCQTYDPSQNHYPSRTQGRGHVHQ